MKTARTYHIYIEDEFGAERLGDTVNAKSEGHARAIARQRGLKKIMDVVLVA